MPAATPAQQGSRTTVVASAISALAAGVIGILIGRSTATATVAERPSETDLSGVYERLDAIDQRIAGAIARPAPNAQPAPASPGAPGEVKTDIATVLERIDSLRALMTPAHLDRIPTDLRVPKQASEVEGLVKLAEENNLKPATTRLFGMSRAEVYRLFGEPDSAYRTEFGVHWTYLPDRESYRIRQVTIMFTDGLVGAVFADQKSEEAR